MGGWNGGLGLGNSMKLSEDDDDDDLFTIQQ